MAKKKKKKKKMLHTNNTINNNNLPHGLGLLTTVASLPPKYRSRYLYIKTKYETPLDLTVKTMSPIDNNNKNNDSNNNTEQENENIITTTTIQQEEFTTKVILASKKSTTNIENDNNTMTPPLTPPPPTTITTTTTTTTIGKEFDKLTSVNVKKRKYVKIAEDVKNIARLKGKFSKKDQDIEEKNDINKTPLAPLKSIKLEKTTPPHTHKHTTTATTIADAAVVTTKTTTVIEKVNNNRNKATRKLKFDEENSSPVSGTIIRPLEDITDGTIQYSNGDIDPRYNIVEISEESKAELAAIKNVIGDYICKLCRLKFDDAFGLARHRCACIVLLEYRCPECGKKFNCPANLASHRRWHKPKKDNNNSSNMSAKKENHNTINTTTAAITNGGSNLNHACEQCGKKFKRQAYLRKHLSTHIKAKSTNLLLTDSLMPKQVSATIVAMKEEHTFETYAGSTSSVSSAPCFSTQTEETEGNSHTEINYDYENETIYDCSSRSSMSSSGSYGRLQIVESGLTEEENIAAAALTNLRNCASVIKHTTLAH